MVFEVPIDPGYQTNFFLYTLDQIIQAVKMASYGTHNQIL